MTAGTKYVPQPLGKLMQIKEERTLCIDILEKYRFQVRGTIPRLCKDNELPISVHLTEHYLHHPLTKNQQFLCVSC